MAVYVNECLMANYRFTLMKACEKVSNNDNFIMTRIFTILQKYIHIKLKKRLDNSNSANPQVAWANLGGPHLYLY